jgi:hypothetical protein
MEDDAGHIQGEQAMNRKEFTKATKGAALERSSVDGVVTCEVCHMPFIGESPKFHHKDSRSDDNSLENCVVVHEKCHRIITAELRPGVDKATRIRDKLLGLTKVKPKIPNRGWGR